MGDFLSPELTRLILEGIAALVGISISWAVLVFKKKTGIDIKIGQERNTDILRRRLREVINNGVAYALNQGENEVMSRTDIALQYVVDGARDTLAQLGVETAADLDVIRRRIEVTIKEAEKLQAQPRPLTGQNVYL